MKIIIKTNERLNLNRTGRREQRSVENGQLFSLMAMQTITIPTTKDERKDENPNFFSQNLDDRTEMTPTCHTAPTSKPNNQFNPFNHNIFFFLFYHGSVCIHSCLFHQINYPNWQFGNQTLSLRFEQCYKDLSLVAQMFFFFFPFHI